MTLLANIISNILIKWQAKYPYSTFTVIYFTGAPDDPCLDTYWLILATDKRVSAYMLINREIATVSLFM